jgi:dihydrofolate synthase / folylpolyglutamate synthase
MGFQWASNYLLSTINETLSRREPSRLERMQALLDELENPQRTYPTVHIGGTSGKGSTSLMIAEMLTASGLKCGLHTKPHLHSMTERARINNVPISESDFGTLLDEIIPALERTAVHYNKPSYYETLLALAFTYFEAARVDIAVIEVGIGGKLDGTNVLAPLVTAITNVGLDHCDVLGETIEAIAADKAGIVKPGVPMVTDALAQARAVIEKACLRSGAPFFSVRDSVEIAPLSQTPAGQHFTVTTPLHAYDISMPVLGGFQQRNAATAILTAEQLPIDYRPAKSIVEHALSRIGIPGRMERYAFHPAVVFDIAHNPEKMRSLVESLRTTFAGRRLHFVMAIAEGKDAREILRAFDELDASFLFTTFEEHGRSAIRPQRLASYMSEGGHWVRVIEDPIEAFTVARRSAAGEDVIVVTGSTLLVGVVRAWFLKNSQIGP